MSDGAFSLWLRSILGLLLVRRPARTSLGVFGGVTAATCIDTFKTLIPSYVNVAALTDMRLALVGALLANVNVLWKKEVFSEELEEKFAAIRRAQREGNLSQATVKLMYIQLLEKELKAVKVPAPAAQQGEIPSRS